MIEIQDKKECCGCGACAQICSRGVITMVPDAEGFLYPHTDASLCIDCGQCNDVCTFGRHLPEESEGQRFLAVRHKDMETVMRSRSGGAFSALSDVILDCGGAVYGAEFAYDLSVRHSRAVSKAERDRFRGSKYIQSDINDCFRKVQEDLDNGKKVLFSGTACQCDALRQFVKDDTHLILVDVLCHGVASPAVWKEYVSSFGRKPVAADFRDKSHYGWKDHRETIYFEDGSRKSGRSFTSLYYKHIMLRPCCSACPFNSTARVTDITLADFWGWENIDPGMNADDKGYSLVLVNSLKGQTLFDKAESMVERRDVDIRLCLQRPLESQVERSPLSESFESDFVEKGIKCVMRKYGDQNLRSHIRYFKKWARKCARKIILGK